MINATVIFNMHLLKLQPEFYRSLGTVMNIGLIIFIGFILIYTFKIIKKDDAKLKAVTTELVNSNSEKHILSYRFLMRAFYIILAFNLVSLVAFSIIYRGNRVMFAKSQDITAIIFYSLFTVYALIMHIEKYDRRLFK